MQNNPHRANESLKQLTDAWQYLTPIQRKRLLWAVKYNLLISRLPVPPRLSSLIAYLWIIFTVTATIIQIAQIHPQIALVLFAMWVVLLYGITRFVTTRIKKLSFHFVK